MFLVNSFKNRNKSLSKARVILSWDFNLNNNSVDNYEYDLDLSCIMENTSTGDINTISIKKSNPNFEHNVIVLHRDNVTGFRSDDEVMDIDFTRIPDAYDKLSILVNAHKGEVRSIYFGKVPNTYISIESNGAKIFSCNMSSKFPKYNAIIPACFTKDENGQWNLSSKPIILHGDKITQVLSSYKQITK